MGRLNVLNSRKTLYNEWLVIYFIDRMPKKCHTERMSWVLWRGRWLPVATTPQQQHRRGISTISSLSSRNLLITSSAAPVIWMPLLSFYLIRHIAYKWIALIVKEWQQHQLMTDKEAPQQQCLVGGISGPASLGGLHKTQKRVEWKIFPIL